MNKFCRVSIYYFMYPKPEQHDFETVEHAQDFINERLNKKMLKPPCEIKISFHSVKQTTYDEFFNN